MSRAVMDLVGLCCTQSCVEQQQQHRKRVKAQRANWNQMSEATGRGILVVEQERQWGKFTSPDCLSVLALYLCNFFFSFLFGLISYLLLASCILHSQKREILGNYKGTLIDMKPKLLIPR
ncbi:hypothetical protein ILYODFUR_007484 [Ilyodon furcidens]|uniref:Uncharacterized protein n=1 Tax=Ilyodon furcidens TaxID=33524 RepID=A0ABV0SJB0_9TELE